MKESVTIYEVVGYLVLDYVNGIILDTLILKLSDENYNIK